MLSELIDSSNITSMRAIEVYNLYQYADSIFAKGDYLCSAIDAIHSAEAIIRRREASYRVPVERISSWRVGPTCYTYGLFTSVS